jgi:hypothetical protein
MDAPSYNLEYSSTTSLAANQWWSNTWWSTTWWSTNEVEVDHRALSLSFQ